MKMIVRTLVILLMIVATGIPAGAQNPSPIVGTWRVVSFEREVLETKDLADPGDNRDTAQTLEALAGFAQFAAAPAIIRRRKAIANAMAFSLAVAEAQPRDAKACEKIAQLVSNLFDVGAMADGHHKAAE
jgi:hypothetical protein